MSVLLTLKSIVYGERGGGGVIIKVSSTVGNGCEALWPSGISATKLAHQVRPPEH